MYLNTQDTGVKVSNVKVTGYEEVVTECNSSATQSEYTPAMTGVFGRFVYDETTRTHKFADAYEAWAGAANKAADICPLAFEEAGNSASLASEFSGSAVVETFTVKMIPEGQWLAVLAINDEGERVIAASLLEQGELYDKFTGGEPIGERVMIEPSGENTHRVVGLV